jgi:hypothetical protein
VREKIGKKMDAYKEHLEFQKQNKVVHSDSELVEKSTVVYEDGEQITINNDEQSEIVTRQVEGKLAEDIRKRVKAAPDTPVFITEKDGVYWSSELTAENYYEMTVKCNGVEKEFNLGAASLNFDHLIAWLAEDPETPIGGEIS